MPWLGGSVGWSINTQTKNVADFIPGQGAYPSCSSISGRNMGRRQPIDVPLSHLWFFPSLFPSPLPQIYKHILGWGLKKGHMMLIQEAHQENSRPYLLFLSSFFVLRLPKQPWKNGLVFSFYLPSFCKIMSFSLKSLVSYGPLTTHPHTGRHTPAHTHTHSHVPRHACTRSDPSLLPNSPRVACHYFWLNQCSYFILWW